MIRHCFHCGWKLIGQFVELLICASGYQCINIYIFWSTSYFDSEPKLVLVSKEDAVPIVFLANKRENRVRIESLAADEGLRSWEYNPFCWSMARRYDLRVFFSVIFRFFFLFHNTVFYFFFFYLSNYDFNCFFLSKLDIPLFFAVKL